MNGDVAEEQAALVLIRSSRIASLRIIPLREAAALTAMELSKIAYSSATQQKRAADFMLAATARLKIALLPKIQQLRTAELSSVMATILK